MPNNKPLTLKKWRNLDTSIGELCKATKYNFEHIEEYVNQGIRYRETKIHIAEDDKNLIFETPQVFNYAHNEFDVYLNRVLQLKNFDYDEYKNFAIKFKEPPQKDDEIYIIQRIFI